MYKSVLLALCLVATILASVGATGVIEGKLSDIDSGAPISSATIQIEGAGRATTSNDEGRYRLVLAPGNYRLKFSHLAYYSDHREVTVSDSTVTLDVPLHTSVIVLEGAKVYERAYDPGQRIILEAIARKQELLNQLQDYRFEAYTKLVVRNQDKDSNNILVITETQIEGFWEQPDKYKETITARRQSSNLPAENNLITVGQILNFNANRIDIDRYSAVSPTATDALDYYNYYLLDTIQLDGKPVFHLEIEPKNDIDPLFSGTIDIADSSYAVVGVDVVFGEGFNSPPVSNVRYRQRFAQFESKFWMPVEISYSLDLAIRLAVISVDLTADFVASLYDYQFELVPPEGTFNEFVLEVDEHADDIDSTRWAASQVLPLTSDEIAGYHYIDSLAKVPPKWYQVVLTAPIAATAIMGMHPEFVHFNRVEGAYLGGGGDFDLLDHSTTLHAQTGYAFGPKLWQYHSSAAYRLSRSQRLWVTVGLRDQVASGPTLFSGDQSNQTIYALWGNRDPLNYYRERGFYASLKSKLTGHIDGHLGYRDYRQESMQPSTDWGVFTEDEYEAVNLPISDGRLRSVRAGLSYDSQPMWRNKGRDERYFGDLPLLQASFEVEHADPDLIDNDFDFTRYQTTAYFKAPTLGAGITSISLKGGWSERNLPPQRFFSADYMGGLDKGLTDFKTLDTINYTGAKAASFYVAQDFGRWVWKKSHIPLVEDIPASLLIFGGAFWTEFDERPVDTQPERTDYFCAPKGYSEIGFGLGQIPPLGFRLYFAWRVTDRNMRHFSFNIGGGF